MTTTSCDCGKPNPESAYICADCTDELWDALNDVPELVDELDITLSRQQRFDTQTSAARSSDDALPFDIAASNALAALRAQLTSLVRWCVESNVSSNDYRDRSPGSEPKSMSTWLSYRVHGITMQPWAAQALDIKRAVARAERVIDRPSERTYAGPCDHCGHDLYARASKQLVTCHDCGISYDLAARRAWLLRVVDDRLATAAEISRALTSLELPVTAERIRQWKHRERIDVRAHDKLDRPLFRVGDIVQLLRDETARHAS